MGELQRRTSRELIESAASRGILSPESSSALQRPAITQQVQRALEGSYSVKRAGELLLVTMMPDDSGSMSGGKQRSVVEGHNELLTAMTSSSYGKRIMLQTRYLNGTVLNPFRPLAYCQTLSLENYPCIHGTPLLEQTLVTLGAVMAKTEELTEREANVRSATLIMTDGEATDTRAAELKHEVSALIRDMGRVGNHIVAGMGFADGSEGIFREAFAEMGIDPQYIFRATSREEILQAFRLFTKKALDLTARSNATRRVHEA
jgi:hypothetical protein